MEISGISATPVHIQSNNEIQPSNAVEPPAQQSQAPQVKMDASVGQYIDATA